MKLNWNFIGGGGVQNKNPSMGGVEIFSLTAHFRSGVVNISVTKL